MIMANRTQRRAQKKAQPRYERMTQEQKKAALFKNGLTKKDMDKEYEQGYRAGEIEAIKTIYAALCLGANEVAGFGHKRLKELLRATDRHVLESVTSEEIMDEVFAKFGLALNFGDPFERVEDA
jgi:hypothetical protein